MEKEDPINTETLPKEKEDPILDYTIYYAINRTYLNGEERPDQH